MNLAAIEAYIAVVGPILNALNVGLDPLIKVESADIQQIWVDARKAQADFMANLQAIVTAVKAVPKP